MADATSKPKTPLLIMQDDVEGYCDPVTGVCSVPGAGQTNTEPSTSETTGERHRSSPEPSTSEQTKSPDRD